MAGVLVLAALFGGVALGVLIAMKCGRRSPGFWLGMLIGAPFTLWIAISVGAYLGFGLGEMWFGPKSGIVFGIFVGALAGAFIPSCIWGMLGAGVAWLIRSSGSG